MLVPIAGAKAISPVKPFGIPIDNPHKPVTDLCSPAISSKLDSKEHIDPNHVIPLGGHGLHQFNIGPEPSYSVTTKPVGLVMLHTILMPRKFWSPGMTEKDVQGFPDFAPEP